MKEKLDAFFIAKLQAKYIDVLLYSCAETDMISPFKFTQRTSDMSLWLADIPVNFDCVQISSLECLFRFNENLDFDSYV